MIFKLTVACVLGSSAGCSTSCRRGLGAARAGIRVAARTKVTVENFMVRMVGYRRM